MNDLPLVMQILGATIVGAVVGSFLNVCIYRLPLGRSVVWPASACPACKRPLAFYENVPIVSFLVLGGRCRSCRTSISWRYPLIEALTGCLFAFLYWRFGPTLLFVSRAVFGAALIALFAIDLEHHLLPNAITLPGIVVGFAFSLFTEPGWLSSLIGILAGGGILWGIAEAYYRIRHEDGLGMGDVKMLAMVGAFIGWQLTLLTLVLASVAGSILGVFLIATRRGNMKYALPFGTFLAVGAGAAMTVGPAILAWYLGQW
ncbi:MAG TPA: prepilin peptidase [Vicinamibacterales bacterium]|jgi:leader peptidase (prepilin peptidase)/N-methyltransferase